jgi:hypothetical protein
MRNHALATAQLGWAAASGHETSWPNIYRDSGCNKSGNSGSVPGRRGAARRPRKVWQPARRATMVQRDPAEEGSGFRMNGTVQLIGFVVLAAIVLAAGFGALGATLAAGGL